MSSVGIEETHLRIALVAGRTLWARCLARFLEMRGLGVRIVTPQDIRDSLLGEDGCVDVAIIDTGQQTCRDPDIRMSFSCLHDALPSAPIVVISDREDWSTVTEAMSLGVQAYFPSSLDPEILLETLRFVQKGGTLIPRDVLIPAPVHRRQAHGGEGPPTEMHGLTKSEQRVLGILKQGKPNKVIARELDIEETTVKVHVRRIMKKLHAANRTQAALLAQQIGGAVAIG